MEDKKPLSPHIQIYRWHISSLVSISHRITGIINIIAITFICFWSGWLILGEAKIVWWIIPIMLTVGFLTPWPYNYYRLKKFNIACH